MRAVVPGAKVVYSDVDPYTLQVARDLVAGLPDVLYLEHDVRQARSLLETPRVTEFLGGERRVALGFSGITVFLSPDEIRALLRDLYDWAAPGSRRPPPSITRSSSTWSSRVTMACTAGCTRGRASSLRATARPPRSC